MDSTRDHWFHELCKLPIVKSKCQTVQVDAEDPLRKDHASRPQGSRSRRRRGRPVNPGELRLLREGRVMLSPRRLVLVDHVSGVLAGPAIDL